MPYWVNAAFMKTLRLRILCVVFSFLFSLNITSGSSFGENLLKNWRISTTLLLEETLPGASLLLYSSIPFSVTTSISLLAEICDNGIDDDGDGDIDCADADCTTSGNADVVISQTGVTNPNNALGAPDAVQAQLWDTGDQMVLDLTDEIPSGNDYTIRWRRDPGTSADPNISVEESANGSTWSAATGSPFTFTTTTYFDQTITASTNTRYLRFTSNNVYNVDLDAVSYSFSCSPSEICNNGIDDDGDGFIDEDCPEICDNGIDDDGDGLTDCNDPDCSSFTEYSTDIPKTISATVSSNVTSTINIITTGIINDINIDNLNISHTYIQDIIVTLTSPSGTAVALLNQPCAGENNILMDFDDEASTGVFPCPPTNGQAYQPFNLLSTFDGEDINGIWTLRVYDVYGPLDGGSLDGWGLEISLDCPTEICNNGIDDDSDGLIDCDDPDCSLSIGVNVQRTSCASAIDGAIDLAVAGGDGIYSFEWDIDGVGDNDDTEDLSGLGTGTYNVTVTDAGSCTATLSVNVSSKNEFPYSAMILTGADVTTFPTATIPDGYYIELPTGSDSFDFSFDHAYIPGGYALDADWLGTGTFTYTMNDVNPSSNAYQFVGERVTEISDFNPGDIANESGRVYDVYGRGHFTYNSGTDPAGHSWTVTYDFTTMVNGYLPTGTLLSFVDIDGVAVNGESVLLSATVPSGIGGTWLTNPPYDLGYNPPESPHNEPTYNSGNKTYFFNGPAASNTSIAFLTTTNLTSITMEMTHGRSGGSYGVKFAAPIHPEPFTANATSSNCTDGDGTITVVADGTNLEYSVDAAATFQNNNVFTGLAPGNYNLVVRDITSACERIFGGNPVVVGLIPCGEVCDNRLDDDGDGLTDCDDTDCHWITISNIVVSDCIDHPLADIATVELDISWTNAPVGDMIEVSIFGKKEYIPVEFLAPPQSVIFNVPADGSTANLITASWWINDYYCLASATYDAPAACSNDDLFCNILYISGNYSPADGNAWDNGWLQYLDQLNGAGNLENVLVKPDVSGLGLYDPSNPTTTVNVNFSEYDLIIISATTQQQIATELIAVLKDLPGVILNSNSLILNDLGMTTAEGLLNAQDHAFVNNSTQRRIYNFNNINPTNTNLVARGDFLANANAVLWSESGGQVAATGGVHFGYDITDALFGVNPAHGKRVFLGYQMDGVYANGQNAGALPAPNENWFDPIKHLTLEGKYYFDLALKQATSNCSGGENCYNDIDDDGDGLTDCKDPDCTPIPIPAVLATYRTTKSGGWANNNTWLGGIVPPVGIIDAQTISVEHDVTLTNGDIILNNGSKLWVTNASLTLKGGLLDIIGSTAKFTNASLITWSGHDVTLSGTKSQLYMTNSSADIGGNFENGNGIRVLENVCLTVQEQYINAEKDSLFNVCATIGNDPNGGFRNTFYSQIYLEDTEINIVNGDLDNDLLGYIDGSNMKIWVQSGNLNNNGFWTADVSQYCVFGSNSVPSSQLPATEECGTISWYFDNCDCGCLPAAEICTGGIDEDGDGLFDCDDIDCGGAVDAGLNVQSCSGENVDLTATITAGTGTYTYTWSHSLGSTPTVTVNPTVTTVYSVTISNVSGCSSMDSVTVTMGICSEICTNGIDDDGDGLIDCDDPDCRLTVIGTPQSPICFGGTDGLIDEQTTGGKPPYSYNWSTGATTEDINELSAGIYQVTTTDTYGCSATASFVVDDGYTFDLSAEITHSNCYGDATGSINLTVTGGAEPFSYAWSNGETTEDIAGLTSGIYGVTIYDANACSQTGFYTVLHALNSAYLTYYIPLPEENIHSSLKKFTDAKSKSISSSIRSIISMVSTEDGTLLYYDHWEDGYETDIFNPTQSTTEIWGDEVNSNGKPPGFSTDQLNTGDVIGVDNSVNMPRNPNQIRYDGKDKIVSSHQLALSRAAWAPTPGPVLSGAVDIMDINAYGKEFEVPIGEDIVSNNMFSYTSILVMAQSNNTFVYIDIDGNGSVDITQVLAEGETYQMDGGVESGLKITTSIPVQVHLVTGDFDGYYENRWFTLFPCERWDNSYFAPVGTTISSDPAHVFIYNPSNTSISVNYATKSGTGAFNISSKGVHRFEMPMHSGAHFYTNSENDVFFAMSTIDSDSGDHDAHDWGYNLLPESYLTVSATIGWGPGNADFSGNGSPAWVIASEPTTLYVDYDGDPTTGSKIDPAGNQYDADFNLSSYESQRVFDNNDNDQTGMYLYTLDGALISVAWGQDPLTAAPGNPYLDFGTTVPPIRKINGWKEYELTNDFNGDGLVDPGDELTFYLKLQNSGNSPVEGLTVFDPLPPELVYVPNTTLFNNSPLADNTSGTLFPVDELGYFIASIPVNTTYVISFRATVVIQPPLFDLILNQFTTLVTVPCKTIISEVEVPVVPYTSTVDDCTLQFTNDSGSPVSNYSENSQVCVQISDSDQNESETLVDFFEITILNSNNDDRETITMIETGVNTGVYQACIASSPAAGTVIEDGILLALGNHSITTSFTDPVYGETCSDNVSFILITDTKPLYLTDAGVGLDRIDPVAVNDTTTSVVGLGTAATANCTIADGFNAESYSNNDGTVNWSNDWQELGESNGASDSYVKISHDALRFGGSDDDDDVNMTGRGIWREADLSGATSANLSLDFTESYSSSFTVDLSISGNGGSTYTTLGTFTFSTGNVSMSYDISSYIASNTRIRLLASGFIPEDATRKMYFDNIEITYNCVGSGSGSGGGTPIGSDMAIWSASGTTEYNTWDGTSFGTTQNGENQGDRWRIMQGSSAPTRDEKIIIGVEDGGEFSGALWNGSTWDNTDMTALAVANQTYWWGCDAAYEQVSGDGMIIWSGGDTYSNILLYQIWDGTSWSGLTKVAGYTGSTAMHMQLAANPTSDEMVLIVNDAAENDFALVWDGANWGNAVTLDNTTSQDRTDIYVTYESLSGDAMVVYNGNADANLQYRIWDGASWSSEATLNAPSGVSSYARWSVLASDNNSDKIIVGVQSSDPDGWVAVWNGSSWESSFLLTESSLVLDASTAPNVAVAFEQSSGDALATYGRSGQNVFLYRNWSSGSGWGSEQLGTNVGKTTNSMRLYSQPLSDTLMQVVQDDDKDLHYILWNGSSWGTDNELETNTGEDKNQPFVFLWGASSGGTGGSSMVAGDSATFTQVTPMCTDLEMPAGGVLQVTTYVSGKSTVGTSSTINSIISINSDDVEEEGLDGDNNGPGYMYHNSTDLEIVSDIEPASSGTQKIGLRFQNLGIPAGATITNAHITFRAISADSPNTNSGTTNLTIKCEAADNATAFGTIDYYLTNLTTTSAGTSWTPGSWSTGVDYDTPDLSTTVQEIVDRPGWASGNSMVFVIKGTGSRSAYSWGGSSTLCPRLTIEYTTGGGADIPANPDITAVLKHGATTFATLNNPVYSSSDETMIWSSILGSNYTLPAGEKVSLEIIKNDAGYSFDIEYDSETKPSKIDLPTQTIINVEELAVYDSLYPNGLVNMGAENGETVYIRTTVSDPFGPEDVTSLDLVVTSPSGIILVDTTLNDQNAVASIGCNKVYEFVWVTGVEQGIYTIDVVAHEGYEGITDEASTTIEIQYNDFGSPCQVLFTDGINEVDEYNPDDVICGQVTDVDENKNASVAESVTAILTSSSGDNESVTLVETGINTGIFAFCLNASSTVIGASNNGTLYAPMGALVSLNYIDPDILDNDVCTTTALVNSISPDVDIAINLIEPVDGVALVGEAIQFDITVTNTGPTALTSLSLDNTFNASQLNYVGSSLLPSSTSTGSLNWIINAVVPSGGSFIIETYFTGAAPSNPAVSTALVSGNDEFSTAVAAGPVTDDVIITNPLLQIDKYLTDPLSGIYLVGDTITFQIDISNIGSTAITTLPLADQFGASCIQFVDAIPAADGAGGGVVVWEDLGTLGTSSSTSLTTRFVIVDNCSPIENTAAVTFAIDENGDPVPPVEDMESLEVETPPVAIDDTDSTGISTPVVTNVPDNDYDFNGNLDIGSVTSNNGILQPSHGSIIINTTTGQITYAPNNGYSGADMYEYIICDSTLLCDTALVTILIVNEDCNNGIDDDGDGLIDCDDPDCSGYTSGGFIGGNESSCGEYDPDQIISLSLPAGGSGGDFEFQWQYSPNGGLSWLVIIGATDVEYDPPVISQTTFFRRGARRFTCGSWKYSNFITKSVTVCPEICDNGIDDDEDGLTDCEDSDCAPIIITSSNLSICEGLSTTITATASGGISPYEFIWDNGLGEGESQLVAPTTTTTYRVMVISASGCISLDSLTITVVVCSEICADGIDNNGDGLIDCDDPDCQKVGQPYPVWDSYTTCPGKDFIEQVIFNDNNLHDPSFSIFSPPQKGTVSINYQGVFVYSPYNSACGRDSFVYQICNQTTGCCDTASVFLNIGDNLPPILQNIPPDITIGCDETVPDIPDLVFALDVCPGIYLTYSQSSTQQASNTCDSYTITRTWEATDLCGNTAIGSQIITVEDLLRPELFRVYTLPNGKRIAGGVDRATSDRWKYVEFPVNYATRPVVFSQVASENEMDGIIVRVRNISKQGFEMRLLEEEGGDGVHNAEDVSWIAVEQGAFQDGSFEAALVPNVNSALTTLNFVNSYGTNPAFISNVLTYDDSDPISIRYQNMSGSSVSLSLQEEASFDTEGIHGNEDVGYIACKPGGILDEDGTFVGEVGTLSLKHQWVTVQLSREYNKPVVVFGGMTINGSHPSVIRIKDVTATNFKVRVQEWDYLDGSHAFETVSYMVMEGNIPVVTDIFCDTEAVPLVLGGNLFATDNCDQQLVFTFSDSTSFDASGLLVFRSWTATDDCGNVTTIVRTDTCTRAAIQLKIFLHGSIIGNFGVDLMRDELRQKGYIPLTEPYSDYNGFIHQGDGGGETTTPGMLAIAGNDAIVDWVFVELRGQHDPTTVIATRSALLQRDGDVITAEGDSVLYFPLLPADNYYVSVKHRNHLGTMTGEFHYLVTNAVPKIDFRQTSFAIFGQDNALNDLGNGTRALWLGDISGDELVIYQGPDNDIFNLFSHVLANSDNDTHLANFISHGYHNEDVNMDGFAIYQGPNNDRAILLYHTLLPHPGNSNNLGNFIVQALLP